MIDQDIMSDVADLYGITVEDIVSRCRVRKLADARAVVCYLLHGKAKMSCVEVGQMIHRTHATVLYFKRRACEWVSRPALNRRAVCAIKELEKRYGG